VALGAFEVLHTARWYATALPLPSGHVAVLGGHVTTGELVPNGGAPFELQFLNGATSFYPIAHVLSDGSVFVLSDQLAAIVSMEDGTTIKHLPPIAGLRTYPSTGGSVLLPLLPSNNYTSRVLVCGGGGVPAAIATCGVIEPLTAVPTWHMFDMPHPWVMPDLVLLLDGSVLVINGAQVGFAGFGASRVPNFQSYLLSPMLEWSPAANTSVARMYHSEAVVLEDGSVFVCGSGGDEMNAAATLQPGQFSDEKRIERFAPAYLSGERPVVVAGPPVLWNYSASYEATLNVAGNVTAALFVNGHVTHSQHMGQRLVYLSAVATGSVATITAPPSARVAPPGWYMLFVLVDGVPSMASWVRLGGDPASVATWPFYPQAPYATTKQSVPFLFVVLSSVYGAVSLATIGGLAATLVVLQRRKRQRTSKAG
jgi:hypothetical protein